jgi:nicotinate-nucleotide adenylyltransferase
MRLGLFGGTFDPIHYGHLILAEQCREQIRLDRVRFVPAGDPPHKRGRVRTPARQRAEMIEMAIAGHEPFELATLEIDRTGPSYTVDTLEQLGRDDPECELFFLIGSDSLADLSTWREPKRIAELATLVVVTRPDAPLPDFSDLVPLLGTAGVETVKRHVVEMPLIGISSTDLRRRVHQGRSIRYLLPRAVECYIKEQGLYGDGGRGAP